MFMWNIRLNTWKNCNKNLHLRYKNYNFILNTFYFSWHSNYVYIVYGEYSVVFEYMNIM